MTKIQINKLHSVECEISKEDAVFLAPMMTVAKKYWQQGRFKKIQRNYKKQMWTRRGKHYLRFHTGLLPKILTYCKRKGISVDVYGEDLYIPPDKKPSLKGITLRKDQVELVRACTEHGRGLIKGGTGIGKTVVQAGVISCYKNCNVLLLAHTTSITSQSYERFKQYGFKDIELFGGGNKVKRPTAKIVISTIQSFAKLDPELYMDYFDIVIVDEAHRVHDPASKYAEVLSNMLAPNRWGFTATPPTTPEGKLVSEGLFGPIIGELSIQKATKMGILAKPKLVLKRAKYGAALTQANTWQQAYQHGIVENKLRNTQIVDCTAEYVENNDSVLIFVVQINHGTILKSMLEKKLKFKVPFVQGSMPEETRTVIKKNIIKGKLKVVIASIAWAEGVDIPDIAAVIIADGGMSETRSIQKIGRGLRTTKDKDTVEIVDFLDLENRHLLKHTGNRLITYSDNGWL